MKILTPIIIILLSIYFATLSQVKAAEPFFLGEGTSNFSCDFKYTSAKSEHDLIYPSLILEIPNQISALKFKSTDNTDIGQLLTYELSNYEWPDSLDQVYKIIPVQGSGITVLNGHYRLIKGDFQYEIFIDFKTKLLSLTQVKQSESDSVPERLTWVCTRQINNRTAETVAEIAPNQSSKEDVPKLHSSKSDTHICLEISQVSKNWRQSGYFKQLGAEATRRGLKCGSITQTTNDQDFSSLSDAALCINYIKFLQHIERPEYIKNLTEIRKRNIDCGLTDRTFVFDINKASDDVDVLISELFGTEANPQIDSVSEQPQTTAQNKVGATNLPIKKEKTLWETMSDNAICYHASKESDDYASIMEEIKKRQLTCSIYKTAAAAKPNTVQDGNKNQSDFISFEKQQCEDIGFKPGTEKFADCVLELVKRNKSNETAQTSTENSQQKILEEIKQANEEMILVQKKALQAQQRAIQKAQQEAKANAARQQFWGAVTNLGLGIATGQNYNLPSSNNSLSVGSVPGFLSNNYVSGMNRICVYRSGGGQKVKTIGASELCPISY